MKRILFLATAIAVGLTSCGSDNDPEVVGPPEPPAPPAFNVVLERAIEGDWNEDKNDYDYTYKSIESVVYTAEDDGYFDLRIKANVDWEFDLASIPAVFDADDFTDNDDVTIGAKANEFSEVITLSIYNETAMETLPSDIVLKIKDKTTSKTVDIKVQLLGVGDAFIGRSDDGEYENKVAKTGVAPLVFEFSHSPAYKFKIVALERAKAVKEATWITSTKKGTKAALLKTTISCAIADNPGEPREALLYAIPESATVADVFEYNEDYESVEIKAAYEDKAFGAEVVIMQAGKVALKFAENNTNALTKSYSAGAVVNENPFIPGVSIDLITSAYCGSDSEGAGLRFKEADLPVWIERANMTSAPKTFGCNLAANTGAAREYTVVFYYFTSNSDAGTEVGRLTIKQAGI